MAVMVAWISAWGGVTIADYYLVRQGRVNIAEIYSDNPAHRYGVNWAGMIAFVLGLIASWLLLMGSLPALQGPIALGLGGIDLTWLAGFAVSGVSYLVLEKVGWPVATLAPTAARE